MERRSFLKKAGAGIAVGAAAGMAACGKSEQTAAPATTPAAPAVHTGLPAVQWRMTSSFPKSIDTLYGSSELLANRLREITGGKFDIRIFPAGEIVPGLQALDAVSSGTVECAHSPTYFYIGKDPTLGLGTGIPFGLNARQQHSWWYFGGGEQIVNGVLDRLNAYSIPCGNSGCQMGGFFRNELKSIDDLKGLKFRIGGMGGAVLSKLGVVPTQIAPGDVYPALERGAIDAAEFVGPYDDEKLGFIRVAKYYYYPGWWEGGAMLHLIIGKDAWNKLPKHYQAIVQNACEAANNWMLAKYDFVNPGGLRRLVAQGAQLRGFPLPVMEAALKAAEEYYAETGAKSPDFRKGYDSMVTFRGENLLWWQIAELSYDSFMNRLKAR